MLCETLDFLATDHWDYRFDKPPVEEMNRHCSAKYGRPFDVCELVIGSMPEHLRAVQIR